MFRGVQQLGFAAQAAEDEVAVGAVFLAVGAHVPAHAGVDQGVRGDQADFRGRVGQGDVLGLQPQPFAAGLEQRAQHLGAHRAVRDLEHLGMGIGQGQAFDMRCALVVLVEQVKVGVAAVVDEQRTELFARDVALQVLVICQVFGRVFADIGIDVLGCLLPADAETLHQMVGGQAPLPPDHRLDQAVAQGQVPAHMFDRLLAFHGVPPSVPIVYLYTSTI
ncbi:hypothetical protein D3C85_799130 [compost metagenome]